MIKYIPAAWKDDLAGQSANFNSKINFYINPRCRIFPALSEAGVSYVMNDSTTNRRGTYRMQCGGSTNLTYLYTLPQRFIIEGWFKPEFAYDVGVLKSIFDAETGGNGTIIFYNTDRKIYFYTSPSNYLITDAFTSDAQLQKWIYIRAYYDNAARKKGMYIVVDGTVFYDSASTPSAGAFIPVDIPKFFYHCEAEVSFFVIHELDETLATGEYKTYQADRQIMFDFNGITMGRERIRIPRVISSSETRGVKSWSLMKAEKQYGSPCANTATLDLYNINGQFSDDQYDAFDPFNGYYNGTQKYLQNRVGVEIETQAPAAVSANDYWGYVEPIFIGRTTPGAFSRSSPNKYMGMVSIEVEDGIVELGETKLARSYAYNSDDAAYRLFYPTDHALSLFHLYCRLVTKHEIRQYLGNNDFENATIANSWTNSGMATFERSNTYALMGTYSMHLVSDTIGDNVIQVVTFENTDLINVGDIFNFSAYILQQSSGAMTIKIEELDTGGSLLGTASTATTGSNVSNFVRLNVSRTILSGSCTRLRVTFYANAIETFYVDTASLTRGIDPLDYIEANTGDGASGVTDADDAKVHLYDTMEFDVVDVDLQPAYVTINKGDTVWSHLKKFADASIGLHLGMTADGILKYTTAYNETDPSTIGAIDDVQSISTTLESNAINAIEVHGIVIDKSATPQLLGSAETIAGATLDSGNNLFHAIDDTDYLYFSGIKDIEIKYNEDTSTAGEGDSNVAL